MAFGHGGGTDLPLVIHADRELFPALTRLFAVFPAVPFVLAWQFR